MNGLQVVELKQAGMIARLTGRKVKENAYLEIHNRLATTPIQEIPPDAVELILAEYDLTLVDTRPRLKELYTTVLRYFVHDRELSDAEVEDLRRLRDLFGLTDRDVREIETAVLHPIYRGELQAALADQHLTPEEKVRLDALARRLRLPDDVVQTIYKEDTTALLQRVLNQATADRRLSPEEEGQLAALADNLGAKIAYDAATLAALDRCRLLWRIEQGDLPDVPVPIRLQRGERCHANIPAASHYELRRVTRAIRYAGPTARIKIVKGLYWRMGQISLDRVTQEVLTLLDTGTLYVTSKRFLFDGAKKNTSIPLGRIINFTVYQNGIQVEKDSGKDQFFECEGDLELLGVIMGAALTASRG